MKSAYHSLKIKYDNVTTKLTDLTKKYDALRRESERFTAVKTRKC